MTLEIVLLKSSADGVWYQTVQVVSCSQHAVPSNQLNSNPHLLYHQLLCRGGGGVAGMSFAFVVDSSFIWWRFSTTWFCGVNFS